MTAPSDAGGEFDVTAGEPPVPLALWRTPRDVGGDDTAVPSALAARLCAAYSRPDEPVVDAIGELAIAAAASAYGRRHIPTTVGDLAHALPVEQRVTWLVLLRWPLQDTAKPANRDILAAERPFSAVRLITACGIATVCPWSLAGQQVGNQGLEPLADVAANDVYGLGLLPGRIVELCCRNVGYRAAVGGDRSKVAWQRKPSISHSQ